MAIKLRLRRCRAKLMYNLSFGLIEVWITNEEVGEYLWQVLKDKHIRLIPCSEFGDDIRLYIHTDGAYLLGISIRDARKRSISGIEITEAQLKLFRGLLRGLLRERSSISFKIEEL